MFLSNPVAAQPETLTKQEPRRQLHLLQPAQGESSKRRRAASPGTIVSEAQRVRLETVTDGLAGLSVELQMVQQAADAGIDSNNPRPRAMNRRHAVSHEFPVPQ